MSARTTAIRLLAPVAVVGVAALMPGVASAASTTYTAQLDPLNNQKGSGTISISLDGDQATVDETVSGLAETFQGGPFPHAQHIHGIAQGNCPSPSADKNGDGVVNVVEAMGNYGDIQASLTKTGDSSPKSALAVTRFNGGSSYTLHRTYTLSAAAVKAVQSGKGVVVVHGADPALISKKAQGEKSELDPSLPLAATLPALCGVLSASQTGTTPAGSVNAGGGSTAGVQDTTLLAAGGISVLAAGVVGGALVRRRRGSES